MSDFRKYHMCPGCRTIWRGVGLAWCSGCGFEYGVFGPPSFIARPKFKHFLSSKIVHYELPSGAEVAPDEMRARLGR